MLRLSLADTNNFSLIRYFSMTSCWSTLYIVVSTTMDKYNHICRHKEVNTEHGNFFFNNKNYKWIANELFLTLLFRN